MRATAFAALTLAAALAAASPAHAEPVLIDRIVAVVNDGVILQSELDRAIGISVGQLRDRGITNPPENVLRTQVLDRLINTRVQTQKAQEGGIRIDDRELNEVLANIAQQNKMSLAQFAEAVRKDGMDFLAVREQIRDEVLIARVRQQEVDSRAVVTDQDIDLFLANPQNLDDAEYRLSVILVAVPEGATPEQREVARSKALALKVRLDKGEDFAQLAAAESDGQQALQGGDLDWRKGANLPGVFANAAPKLKVGEISGVLDSAAGYHLIKLTDKRGGGEAQTVVETKAQHILLQTNAIRDEAATLAQARDLEKRLKAGESFDTLAKEFSDDPGSKNAGGDLGFQPPGVFAPEFQIRIDQLQPGETSAPFNTQFGWHIARVNERRTRDTSVESRRAKARAAIGQRKSAEEYEVWLRRLRDEAYVEMRAANGTVIEPAAATAPVVEAPKTP
ncbi:MAG: peptidylprolyl isomerase [Stagnimonas sp.]|nr:peptidylprolyl isomerase [Stagnimonas sp.]